MTGTSGTSSVVLTAGRRADRGQPGLVACTPDIGRLEDVWNCVRRPRTAYSVPQLDNLSDLITTCPPPPLVSGADFDARRHIVSGGVGATTSLTANPPRPSEVHPDAMADANRTKMSRLPSSGVSRPNSLVGLVHFIVPWTMARPPSIGAQKKASSLHGTTTDGSSNLNKASLPRGDSAYFTTMRAAPRRPSFRWLTAARLSRRQGRRFELAVSPGPPAQVRRSPRGLLATLSDPLGHPNKSCSGSLTCTKRPPRRTHRMSSLTFGQQMAAAPVTPREGAPPHPLRSRTRRRTKPPVPGARVAREPGAVELLDPGSP